MSGFAHELERKEVTKTDIPVFHVGDTLDVHVRITEGDKERVQIFTGVCIARKGGGLRETFTVRRIVEGEGVERIFPLHSPNVAKVEVKRAGKVRRAKLYYLRGRVGKATRIMEKLNAGHLGKLDDKRTADDREQEPAARATGEQASAEEQSPTSEQAPEQQATKEPTEEPTKEEAKAES